MSCRRWRTAMANGGLERLSPAEYRREMEHLAGCPSCRAGAADLDPTILLAALPPIQVADEEVEQVQQTVRALRRVRALEERWTLSARRVGGAAALAALLLASLLVSPQRRLPDSAAELPFAGAVGIGSGLIRLGGSRPADAAETAPAVVRNPSGPAARIYQRTRDDLVIVVIVDETLDLAE